MINQDGSLPFIQDVFNKIMKYEKGGLVAFSCVSKILASMAIEFSKTYRPEGCFGKAQWLSNNGKTEEEPFLPLKMIQEFAPSKYMLTFIPETINGIFLTLYSIDMFVRKLKMSKSSNYEDPLTRFGLHKLPLEKLKAHWVLLSKEIFPNTLGVEKQEKILKQQGFEISNLIDSVVSLLVHNFSYPYDNEKPTYIFVKECWKEKRPLKIGMEANQKLKIDCICVYSTSAQTTGLAASLNSTHNRINVAQAKPQATYYFKVDLDTWAICLYYFVAKKQLKIIYKL